MINRAVTALSEPVEQHRFTGIESAPAVRAEIVQLAGRVATTASVVHIALPLTYAAMLGDDQVVRAAGMDAAERVMRTLPNESIPPLLAEAVVAGLTDQYLIVVMAAIKAARSVPADLIDHRGATAMLLVAAAPYASDRLRDRMVRDALAAAHHLARDDEHLLVPTRVAALNIVKLMPAYSARETLCRHGWLEPDDKWADATIHALRPDDDWQYESIESDDRGRLLKKLSHRRLTEDQIDAVVACESEASKLDPERSFLAADLFSELGRPELSVKMIESHLKSVPNTMEMRSRRRWLTLRMLAYRYEESVALRQDDVRREIFGQVEELCADV